MTRRRVLLAIGAVAAAALLLGIGFDGLRERLAPVSAVGGPFELVDGQGRSVRDTDFVGRPMAIVFGYTHCPDICPTTLQDMSYWMGELGADARRMSFVFVTVDPVRDTPEALDRYFAHFDQEIVALTGTRAQVEQAIAAYSVHARKVPEENGGYLMDHSTSTFLLDARGHFRTVISYGEEPDAALAKLRALIDEG